MNEPIAFSICMKKGDRRPVLRCELGYLGDGTNPLAGASAVSWIMRNAQSGKEKVNATGSIESEEQRIVAYAWGANDTTECGRFLGRFRVDYGGGVYGSFPSCGDIEVVIE